MDEVLTVLAALAKLVPAFAVWLAEVIDGRTDPISLRVADILPKESAAERAVKDLGWR